MSEHKGRLFPETRASVVRMMGSEDAIARARAMDCLAEAYLEPLYAYVRVRFRKSSEDAQEAVHGFFADALERRQLERYDPSLAHFRTFLKLCIERYVLNLDKAARRTKRGGGFQPLDLEDLDRTIADLHTGTEAAADEAFDRLWTRGVLTLAMDDFERRMEVAGKTGYVAVFRLAVLDSGTESERPSYAAVAAQLGLTVSNVTNYLFAARREFRRSLIVALRALTASEEEFLLHAREMVGPPPYG